MKFSGKCKVNFLLLLVFGLLSSLLLARTGPEDIFNLRDKMVALADSLTGVPYKYGGLDIDGFDCSGFVNYVYDCYGIKLPRSSRTLFQMKDNKIKLEDARPADIIIFQSRRWWHAAIYAGENSFIHSPHRRGTVRREEISDYWKKRIKCVLRVVPN